jgi:glucose-6-phosphate 1-dehydrogenase
LIPALYNLAADGELPPAVAVVGFARRPKTDAQFRNELGETTKKFSRQEVRDEIWKTFSQSIFYHQSEFGDESGYQSLAKRLDQIDEERGTRGTALFYFAGGAGTIRADPEESQSCGLNKAKKGSWARVIIEKPFGPRPRFSQELESGRIQLLFRRSDLSNRSLSSGKKPRRTFWFSVLPTRFLNRSGTRVISITSRSPRPKPSASKGVPVTTKPPAPCATWCRIICCNCFAWWRWKRRPILAPTAFATEKVKVVRSLRRYRPDEIAKWVVRGQYTAGAINAEPVPAYREEERVNPNSETETYVALRLLLDTWRWSEVPIYLRVGKRLPKSATEISVHFKKAPMVLFNRDSMEHDQNVLVIRIQPDEGISLRMMAKIPGTSLRIEPVKMDFHYGTSFGKASPEAYERFVARCHERRRHPFRPPR